MLFIKTRFVVIAVILSCLCGCYKTTTVYTCPFGVGYLTQGDFETISDENLISDQFVTWLLSTNLYCEANDGSI